MMFMSKMEKETNLKTFIILPKVKSLLSVILSKLKMIICNLLIRFDNGIRTKI